MKILIAEDEAFSRKLLEATLEKVGHEVISCQDGEAAIEAYKQDSSLEIAILDWMMPGKDGLEVCKSIKSDPDNALTYVIILTAKSKAEDIALALESGADDFVSKPFNVMELNARVDAGVRKIRLQRAMAKNIVELQEALAHVERLQGTIPICAWCRKIKDDSKFWISVDEYISRHPDVEFSHIICPECMKEQYPKKAAEIAATKSPVTQ